MFDVVLYEPEIPPNTGNIMRLCANTGCTLHLIEPLGFELDEKKVRRAGLDYIDLSIVSRWSNLDEYLSTSQPANIYGFSTKAERTYSQASFRKGDALLFGPETRGLPDSVMQTLGGSRLLRIPMLKSSRSINLSNAVAIVCYEGLRQLDFAQLN
jgi:tRNA (cytidine/uridine-2'-O-)-methyltransferase